MKDARVTQACWLVLTTRARPPVRSEVGLPRLAHIARGAMYAPPEAGFGCASAQPLGTKPECGLESTVSQIALLSRIDGARANEMRRPAAASREGIGWRIHGGVCHVCVERPGCRGSHTSQKARCMRHPRSWASKGKG